MKNKRCLVVGANSFLAAEIISRLMDNNDVTGIYHKNSYNLIEKIKNLPVSELYKQSDDFHLVFIISAYVPSVMEPGLTKELRDANIELPAKICAHFKSAKIIYASSVSVYGKSRGVFYENSVTEPLSGYGESKLEGEKVIRGHGAYSIIRISSIYGKGMKRSTFIPKIIDAAINNKRIVLYGDGSRLQNYIHVSDAAEIFIRSAQQHLNNTYLAVGKRSFSNLEIASMIKTEIRNTVIETVGDDRSDSFVYNGEHSYALLDFEPQKNIQEGITELMQWQKEKF